MKGFVGLLASAALAVLWIVSQGLAQPGPNHLRSAFADHGAGLLSSLESRVPLSYVPALHAWQLVVPLALRARCGLCARVAIRAPAVDPRHPARRSASRS